MMEGRTEHLEARLDAQRRILSWILDQMAEDPERREKMRADFDVNAMSQDAQEDPGAVPDRAFGTLRAFAHEIQMILPPVADG